MGPITTSLLLVSEEVLTELQITDLPLYLLILVAFLLHRATGVIKLSANVQFNLNSTKSQ